MSEVVYGAYHVFFHLRIMNYNAIPHTPWLGVYTLYISMAKTIINIDMLYVDICRYS